MRNRQMEKHVFDIKGPRKAWQKPHGAWQKPPRAAMELDWIELIWIEFGLNWIFWAIF